MTTPTHKTDYGIDAPGLVRLFFIGGFIALVMCFVAITFLPNHQWWAVLIDAIFGVIAGYLIGMGSLMIYWSKVAKVRGRETVLDQVYWRGNEHVLDVGCGRGLMITAAARRLTTGRAVGIDIWQAKDQSANTPNGALKNARIEGVLEKVEIHTADMRALPFTDRSFDVVMSHWVVHNLETESDRSLSLSEMARVLKPDGNLILCDIENRDAYVDQLKDLGFKDCRTVFRPSVDAVLGAISFGSFRPTAIYARKSEA